MILFYKESKSNKQKKTTKILMVRRGGGGDVAGVVDFVFLSSKESKPEKNRFLFEGVKVKEDWLV